MKNRIALAVLFLSSLLCVAFSPDSLRAQNTEIQLSGVVSDPSGGAIAGVRITALQDGANGSHNKSVVSDPRGNYQLSLAPGLYRVHFAHASFASHDSSVDLSSGVPHALDVTLELEALSDSVLVTGQPQPIREQESPAPSSIIGRDEIEARQAVTLPDALIYTPGVSIGRTGANGGTASLFLDGGNSNFTKVLVDGTPINPPGGAVDFSVVTLDNIDKVEIVRGAESALYGTDAVSGVVQLFTNRGETSVPAFSVFSEGGTFSSFRGGGQISGLVNRFDYSGAASYLQTEGQSPNNDFALRTLSGNVGYSFSDSNQIHLAVRENYGEAGIPGQILFTPPSLHQRINQELFSANARWNFATGAHWQHQLMGTESYSSQHSFNPEQSFYATDPIAFCPQANPSAVATAEFCDFTYDSRFQYNRSSIEAQSTYSSKTFSATAGYQYEVENGGISYLEQSHVRRNNQAGYLDFRYSPLRRLVLDVGVRAEANGYFGTRVVPRAGGTYILRYGQGIIGDTRLRAFYGQGIKEPRLDQTYGTDPCDPGNLLLKPEASKNWSAGIEQKFDDDRVKFTAGYFYSRYYDIVSFEELAPTPACPFLGSYFNTDRAFSRGANIALEARVAKWLFANGNYTYNDTRVTQAPNAFDPAEVPGNHLLRRPVNSGSISMTATFRNFSAVFAGYFSGIRTDSDFLGLGYTHSPGYARFDLSASYTFYRGLSIYARATNIFDKQYQDALGYPALGRDARIGMRYRFAGRN
jgi:vitamin B12 transporter